MKFNPLLLSILFILGVITTTVNAQTQDNIIKSLQTREPGEGRVIIHQDPSIEALIGSKRAVSTSGESGTTVKASGYRVQVYAGSNTRDSKKEAEDIGARVKNLFPELRVYTFFTPPRWICRVGDFRSIEEANAMMRKLKSTGQFSEVSIVREQIVINI